MNKFLLVFLMILMAGCTMPVDAPTEENDMTTNARGQVLTRSATPTLFTEMNPPLVPGLNVDNLEPGEYTLQFGLIPPAPVGGVAQVVSAQAIINWKSDSQQQRRVISIVPGASISGVCEGVDVSIQDLGFLYGINTPNSLYKVPITLSKGSRANIQQPPVLLTGLAADIAPGGNHGFLVPRDSGVVAFQVLGAPQLNTPLIASDLIAVQTTNAAQASIHYPLFENGWIPLLPGVVSVIVGNNSAAATATVNVVWGVEG